MERDVAPARDEFESRVVTPVIARQESIVDDWEGRQTGTDRRTRRGQVVRERGARRSGDGGAHGAEDGAARGRRGSSDAVKMKVCHVKLRGVIVSHKLDMAGRVCVIQYARACVQLSARAMGAGALRPASTR
ncbi:hypothetical protein BS78_05G249500 [Paspalum vaginatum]|nr:hypothetical protein BS78_05G249500 [Paspalum vaginatum]